MESRVQLAITAAQPALAQNAETATDESQGFGEIVVTAQKRAESLQDTPISIAAFTAEELEIKAITGLTDLRANVPNLQLTPHPNSAATTQIFMRGVGLSETGEPSRDLYIALKRALAKP